MQLLTVDPVGISDPQGLDLTNLFCKASSCGLVRSTVQDQHIYLGEVGQLFGVLAIAQGNSQIMQQSGQ